MITKTFLNRIKYIITLFVNLHNQYNDFKFSIRDFGHPKFLKSQFGHPVMKSWLSPWIQVQLRKVCFENNPWNTMYLNTCPLIFTCMLDVVQIYWTSNFPLCCRSTQAEFSASNSTSSRLWAARMTIPSSFGISLMFPRRSQRSRQDLPHVHTPTFLNNVCKCNAWNERKHFRAPDSCCAIVHINITSKYFFHCGGGGGGEEM